MQVYERAGSSLFRIGQLPTGERIDLLEPFRASIVGRDCLHCIKTASRSLSQMLLSTSKVNALTRSRPDAMQGLAT